MNYIKKKLKSCLLRNIKNEIEFFFTQLKRMTQKKLIDENFVNEKIHGVRGKDFKNFIKSLLLISKIKSKYIDSLTDDCHLKYYEIAFTHKDYDTENNYEFFELLGDATLNKSLVWYLKDRFPVLNNADGVKILSRLKINLVSKESFAQIARDYNFEPYISFTTEMKIKCLDSVLEDCVESFFGVTEALVNQFYDGLGYKICFNILKAILDKRKISLRYQDLYDSVTRLKECFDYYSSPYLIEKCPYIWGKLQFQSFKDIETNEQVVSIYQFCRNSGRKEMIAQRRGKILDETRKQMCEEYLNFLNQKNFSKPIPKYYQILEKYSN